ncbi:tetratricopeptide repeat protein 8 [Drosophila guanche]|uniref:Blast:Tetratricopeptide repeat protein 8 n=1 Tax=Drosophila guanche TaxID=7266 RepID=A0A3B0JCC0_DROGU|nr:tetratricopeptide repeat protein 8 [Drosophila guanche]SPP79705.1 blast:Tetratricopeptide repeat protein 8 [Drosophila guanche]
MATLELDYFRAVSLYRRRSYDQCAELCNALLQAGHDNNVQMFATKEGGEQEEQPQQQQPQQAETEGSRRFGSNLQRIGPRQQPQSQQKAVAASIMMPTWLMEGVWQLKMRALTQRVYLDDLEVDDAGEEQAHEEVEFERIATAARPGSSIKTAFQPRPSTSQRLAQRSSRGAGMAHSSDGRLNSSRPGSAAVARPGTSLSRPGSSLGARPASRCGTASRVRATSAAAFNVGDATSKLYQASRLNPTIYAERETLVKALFQFLYYHEADVQKAHSLCQAVLEVQRQRPIATGTDWWWQQQMGRCLLALHYPRRAEPCLQQSLAAFPHPDTYLLLSRLYQRLKQPERALVLIGEVVDLRPFDVTYRLEQARIHQAMERQEDSQQLYRLVARLQPINVEALASIAVGYFYDNNPELALMYYRRILSLGAHSAELYCNIALCCLYGGQIDLVLPCFQRALAMATQPEQKADIWYNLSFVAVTSGDFNLARRCLQLCLTSDARNGAALNNLAVLAAQGGDIMGAKSYLNAAKDMMPDAEEVTGNLQFMDLHYKL